MRRRSCTKLCLKCQVPGPSGFLLSPHVDNGHNEPERMETREQSDGGGNINCIITGCCVHVVPVSGFCQDLLSVTRLFQNIHFISHVSRVSIVAQSVLLAPTEFNCVTKHFYSQIVKFDFNMTLYSHLWTNCESAQLRINFFNPSSFLASTL